MKAGTKLGNRISRGVPAKYAHHGIIDKAPKNSNRVSCSKCIYYVDSDKSCSKRKLFIPTAGYDQWKYCRDLVLVEEMDTQQVRRYIEKVQEAVYQKSKMHKNINVPKPKTLQLKNLMTGEVKEYRISSKGAGPNILHPSDALVIKARQAKERKSFYWEGKTYKVIK